MKNAMQLILGIMLLTITGIPAWAQVNPKDTGPKEVAIVEYTKQGKEFLTVRPTGLIQRWSKVSKHQEEQGFVIYEAPEKPGWYRIQLVGNGEFLTVPKAGKARRWTKSTDGSQLFRFDNFDSRSGTFNIQIHGIDGHGAGEYLTVNSHGQALRWAWTGKEEQKFKLDTINVYGKYFSPVDRGYKPEPGKIEKPVMSSETSPFPTSPVVVDEQLITAVRMPSSNYSDKRQQIKNRPYYVLRRSQYWDSRNGRGWEKNWNALTGEEFEETLTQGFDSSSMKSIEETMGWSVSGTVTGKVEGGKVAGDQGGKELKGSVELQLNAQYSEQVVKKEGEQQSSFKSKQVTKTVSLPPGKYFFAAYTLVDRYELIPYDNEGKPVDKEKKSWEYVDASRASAVSHPQENNATIRDAKK